MGTAGDWNRSRCSKLLPAQLFSRSAVVQGKLVPTGNPSTLDGLKDLLVIGLHIQTPPRAWRDFSPVQAVFEYIVSHCCPTRGCASLYADAWRQVPLQVGAPQSGKLDRFSPMVALYMRRYTFPEIEAEMGFPSEAHVVPVLLSRVLFKYPAAMAVFFSCATEFPR